MGANVLTINQNIPIHGIANVTMAVDTKQLKAESDRLISELEGLHGVEKIELLAEE
jgi:chorismate mutase